MTRFKVSLLFVLAIAFLAAGCQPALQVTPEPPTPGNVVATDTPQATTPATTPTEAEATSTPGEPTAEGDTMKGVISNVEAADAQAQASGRLGTIRVEGVKMDPIYEVAIVTVTKDTRILKKDGDAFTPTTFAALEFGQVVQVLFDGPIMESYPIQVKAGKIEILASMPKN